MYFPMAEAQVSRTEAGLSSIPLDGNYNLLLGLWFAKTT